MSDMFPCNPRANTKEFRNNYEAIKPAKKVDCPHCGVKVAEYSKRCWRCAAELKKGE